MTIDWTKPLETEDGRPARLLCDDFKEPYQCIEASMRVVAVSSQSGGERLMLSFSDGSGYFADDSEGGCVELRNIARLERVEAGDQ